MAGEEIVVQLRRDHSFIVFLVLGESSCGTRLLRPVDGRIAVELYCKWCTKRNQAPVYPTPSVNDQPLSVAVDYVAPAPVKDGITFATPLRTCGSGTRLGSCAHYGHQKHVQFKHGFETRRDVRMSARVMSDHRRAERNGGDENSMRGRPESWKRTRGTQYKNIPHSGPNACH